ncbi:MAG: bifunctional diguanylate cyclase/phosphodiesterase [Clostridia bacterium]|nr:bifunctional diguanylate cyclase/phosphodiesterase [Clostridia bacterium]
MPKTFLKVALILLLLIYIIFSYTFDWGADLISPFYNIAVFSVMIYATRNKAKFKSNFHIIAYGVLSWALLDMAWFFLAHFTSYDPSESLWIEFIYITPNVLLLISAIIYFIKNMKSWNVFQLVVDAMTVLVIVMGISSALIFTYYPDSNLTGFEIFNITAYAVTDVFTLTILLVMLASTRIQNISKSIQYVTVGYMLYLLSDYIYVIDYIRNSYIPNSISDILFLASFLHFAFATIETQNDTIGPLETIPSNFGKSKVVYYVVLFALILYALQMISWLYIVIFLGVLFLYIVFNKFAQNFISSEILLKHEKEMKNRLEKLVEERTQDLRLSRDALKRQTITDSLTGLYNRDYFYQISEEKILNHQEFSMIYGDLNRFKIINDLYGHQMGDEVLKIIAKRLGSTMEIHYDLFRVGGDEFVILTSDIKKESLEKLVRSFVDIICQPIDIGQYRFNLDVSIGIASYPKDGKVISDLVKSADIAMYHAKGSNSSDKHVMFSEHMLERLNRRSKVELLLRNVNMDEEFKLFYQPQFNTSTQKLMGMEALLRWIHPEEGFISPGEFIPIAEEIGVITELSYWVFKKAMTQIKSWNDQYHQNWSMAMNMSAVTVNNIHFFNTIRKMIHEIGVDPSHLEFEITEHSAMSTSSIMEEVFAHLTNLGVRIAIDDFGTGYSSLSYLKRFEVDRLKIAKELIDNITSDSDDLHIIKAITMMANGMGLETIGEGVETKEQFEMLRELKCDIIQGYYFGKPMNQEDFENNFLCEPKNL